MTLNDISEQIFVINLKKRRDRKEHIIEQFQTIDCVQYNIVEAVDSCCKQQSIILLVLCGLSQHLKLTVNLMNLYIKEITLE